MKMRGFYCIAFVFTLMFLFSSVSAAGNTTLIVHSSPFHNQIVRVLDPATSAVITSAYTKAYYTGIQNTTFSTIKSKVTFLVIDRHNGNTDGTHEDFGEYTTGGTIEIWLPGAMNFNNTYVEEPRANVTANATGNASAGASVNLSSNITEEVTIEESNGTGLMSGFVSKVRGAFGWFSWKYVLYFLGAVVVIAVIVVAFVFGRNKFMEIKREREEEDEDDDEGFEKRIIEKKKPVTVAQKIADAEIRITEAQKELDEIKDREIKKTERKLEMLKRLGNVQQKIDNREENKDNLNNF